MRKFINLPEIPEESLDILAFVIFFGTVGLFTLFILWGFIYVLGFWGFLTFILIAGFVGGFMWSVVHILEKHRS